jgi:hypothetical protein
LHGGLDGAEVLGDGLHRFALSDATKAMWQRIAAGERSMRLLGWPRLWGQRNARRSVSANLAA